MSTRYLVMSAAAPMPRSCWGRYRRVAVVELRDGFAGAPKMISSRARGIARIVETWERLHVGTTERGAYQRALAEARTLAERLNNGGES